MAHSSSYSMPPPSNMHSDFRLPSLKDLNFQYRPPQPVDGPGPVPSSHAQFDHATQPHPNSSRHESGSWARPASSSHPAPPGGHEQHQKPIEYSPSKHDGPYFTAPGIPLSAQTAPAPGSINSGGPASREDPGHNAPKRSRPGSALSPSPGRSPHNAYASHAPIPYASQPVYPVSPALSQPQDQIHQHPGSYPPNNYPGYPQYMQPRSVPPPQPTHSSSAHPAHPIHAHAPHGHPYPPPTQQAPHPHSQAEHWHHPPPPPPHFQHQQNAHQQHPQSHPQYHHHQQQQQHPPPSQQQQYGFGRTTALVPTNLNEARPSTSHSSDAEKVEARQGTLQEIVKHCQILCSFANRYAQLQASLPHAQPTQAELAEMTQRAAQVVQLLENLRRITLGTEGVPPVKDEPPLRLTNSSSSSADGNSHPSSSRPPKRPWEDMARAEDDGGGAGPSGSQQPPVSGPGSGSGADVKIQGGLSRSTAEQDMEIIRTKRATSSGGGGVPGQPKSKYRKRSRATPPGKCHSCNIRETPEWRRGPDGARTLCNACGLHYAKLMRKRDKALAEGQPHANLPIDLETLKASAATRVINDDSDDLLQSPIQQLSTPVQNQSALGQTQTRPPQDQAQSSSNLKKVSPPSAQIGQHQQNHHPSQLSLSGPGQGPPGPYQLVPVSSNSNSIVGPGSARTAPSSSSMHSSHQQMMSVPPPPPHGEQHQQHSGGVPPPPPWATQGAGRGGYGHGQHDHGHGHPQPHNQSFVRTGHVSNARGSPH